MHYLNLCTKQTLVFTAAMTCACWKDVLGIPSGIRGYKMIPILFILVTCHITAYSHVTSSTQLNKDLNSYLLKI